MTEVKPKKRLKASTKRWRWEVVISSRMWSMLGAPDDAGKDTIIKDYLRKAKVAYSKRIAGPIQLYYFLSEDDAKKLVDGFVRNYDLSTPDPTAVLIEMEDETKDEFRRKSKCFDNRGGGHVSRAEWREQRESGKFRTRSRKHTRNSRTVLVDYSDKLSGDTGTERGSGSED